MLVIRENTDSINMEMDNTFNTFGCRKSCCVRVVPRLSFSAERVTKIPAAVEITKAGICETKPSPILRMV